MKIAKCFDICAICFDMFYFLCCPGLTACNIIGNNPIKTVRKRQRPSAGSYTYCNVEKNVKGSVKLETGEV